MKKIAVFASGGGTDFQSVIDANERDKFCEIKYLVASKEGIGAIERAKRTIPLWRSFMKGLRLFSRRAAWIISCWRAG